MIRLTMLAAGGLLLAAQLGFLPHSPALVALGAVLAALAVIWAGLFART
jgi:hypothetical protein